jgi:wyosine [tRNA(Phe)-imidazoG37] synthetase (radical SAM superfamily)
MPTFLFDKTIFGPVQSRRLGVSLGVNLLPVSRKICNFDCVYCECGLNNESSGQEGLPDASYVTQSLEQKLSEMQSSGQAPDVITFAGNGEPTMHPDFAAIIDSTIALRNKYFPKAKVSVLSNATMLHKAEVVAALLKVDQCMLKLDSGLDTTVKAINQPVGRWDYPTLMEQLKKFKGKFILQTMFVHGQINGKSVDNTSEADLQSWEQAVKEVMPEQVMIYSIERDTPNAGVQRVTLKELKLIAQRLDKYGIKVSAYGR